MNINLTFLGQLITFAVLVAFVYKFVWPPVITVIDARAKTIFDGLAAAETGRKELDAANARRDELLADARSKAANVIKEGERRKAQLLEEARSEAEAEKARIVKDGYSEVEQQRNAVAAELRGQVADLVVEGAEKILSAEVDRSRHEDLLRALSSRI
jgi:F-type H+-transporting ATPase subunit b